MKSYLNGITYMAQAFNTTILINSALCHKKQKKYLKFRLRKQNTGDDDESHRVASGVLTLARENMKKLNTMCLQSYYFFNQLKLKIYFKYT